MKQPAKLPVDPQHFQRGQQTRLKPHASAGIGCRWDVGDREMLALPTVRAALLRADWRAHSVAQQVKRCLPIEVGLGQCGHLRHRGQLLQGKLAVRLGAHGHQKLMGGFSGVWGERMHWFFGDGGVVVQRFCQANDQTNGVTPRQKIVDPSASGRSALIEQKLCQKVEKCTKKNLQTVTVYRSAQSA